MFGYARKMLVFCIVILANMIDQILNANGGIVMMTLFFYITNEGLSIVENCAEMGVLIPKQIAEKLAVIGNDEHKSIIHELKEEMSTRNKGKGEIKWLKRKLVHGTVYQYIRIFTDWNTSYWSKASEWQSKICGIP